MNEAPTKYYLKEIMSTRFWLPNGKQAPWESIGGDTGVLQTNAPNLIFHLDNAAAKHVGGVVPITLEQYEDAKKNSTAHVSPRPLDRQGVSASQGPTAMPQSLYHQPQSATNPAPKVTAAPAAPAAAPDVSTPAPQKVRTGRLKRVAPAIPAPPP